jgi:hypothetical protein
MGTKDYFEQMADIALHHASEVAPDQLRRQVLLILKEVERDTRHRCAEMASALHGEILNSRPSPV